MRLIISLGLFTAAALLVASAVPMLEFAQSWGASEEGGLYDLVLTGLSAMSGMVFTIGTVVIIYVGIRIWKMFAN